MPEPVSAPIEPLALARTSVDHAEKRTVPPLPPLRVRYYQRMKRQRVYPFVVRWGKTSAPQRPGDAATPALVVRPLIPGAQVVPPEVSLEPGQPDAAATFYVTALALGRLPSAQVEVYQEGRRVACIRLRVIVVRQVVTWMLLALALLVPTVLLLTTRDNKLHATAPKLRPATDEEKKAAAARAQKMVRPEGKGAAGKSDPRKDAKGGKTNAAGKKNDELRTRHYLPGAGELLTEKINSSLPSLPGITDNVAWGLGAAYQYTCDVMDADARTPLYLGAGFLALAVLSWLLHTSRRGWAQGRLRPLVV